jgi:hypothetical protein
MTPNDIIVDATRLIQDNQVLRTPDAYSAATMLGYVNQILKNVATVRPDLFITMADIPTVQDVVEQSMPVDSMRLVNIFSVKDTRAVTEVSREAMDRSYPAWRLDPPGVPVNYMRHVSNPNRYFLYPRPAAGVVLFGEYVKSPRAYGLNEVIETVPDGFQATIVLGVVMLVAGTENDSASSVRFTQYKDVYNKSLEDNMQSRVLTDTKTAGLDPKKVV